MKNKYLEVEILPFPVLPEKNQGFIVRNLEKEYQSENKKSLPLRKISLHFFRIGFFFVLFFFPLFSSGQATLKQEIIKLTNTERIRQQLEVLAINPVLEAAAAKKAEDMLQQKYFSHTSPQGKKAWDFILAENYDYLYAGENLAMDYSSAQKTIKAWLDSPAHRKNILDKDFKDIGLAVVEGKMGGRQTTLIVQVFGTEK